MIQMLEKLYYLPKNNISDNKWNIPIFPPVPNNIGSNMNVTYLNVTVSFELGGTNDSISINQESFWESQPSSMDNSIIWTIICDLVGAPCLVSFLYILYRGIEVG